jgi:hypothetical protein
MTEIEASSWRRGKGLADWWFRTCERRDAGDVPPCPAGSEALSEWLAERIRRVIRVLPPFATVECLQIDTRDGGENAYALKGSQRSIVGKFDQFTTHERGIVAARLTFALHCIDSNERPFSIGNGAYVALQPTFDEHGNVDETAGIDLWLTLNVDIYSPRNPCPQRDNTRLATLNGPLLSAFIARLEAEVPCRFDMASGDEYSGFISSTGFDLSSTPENKA